MGASAQPRVSLQASFYYFFVKQRTVLFALVFSTTCAASPAQSEPCDSPHMNTVQRGQCARMQAAEATTQMQKSYSRAVAAAEALLSNGWKVDFLGDIKETQRRWKTWMEAECGLEGNTTMGSAGAFVTPLCEERMARERAQILDKLAEQLQR